MSASRSPKLEDQATTAALFATRAGKGGQSQNTYPLDDDNKLSSAGAATSLKYASPRDLPSYPSAGLPNLESSAGAAASLANANKKTFEHWKPDPSASANKAANLAKDFKAPPLWHPDPSDSANKAANLAKDYKAPPLWHPDSSAAGSKAAVIAAKDGGNVQVWHPVATQAGSSAAGQAMRVKGLKPQGDNGHTAEGSRKALIAATDAMSSGRKRAGSSPVVKSNYPDSENSAANALSAANFANKPYVRVGQAKTNILGASTSSIDAARIHNAAVTNLSREMYTSNPPVAPETEEKNRQAGLRAAAVSMAKQMYSIQQKAIEQATRGDKSDSQYAANSVHHRKASISSAEDSYQQPPQYMNLQEAAQKLAAERLAKLHDEHAEYRSYYGATTPPQSRLSLRGRQRRRASSDGPINESSDSRFKQSRPEASISNSQVAQNDITRRQKDRDSLMAAAQRNVRASMHGIDEKVFAETGKASPAMMQSWEAKARARAEADSKARMVNHGMVHIGAGKYLDQSEIDAIAAQRVQPTLNEIYANAEKQRARDEQVRLEDQERHEFAAAKVQDDKERSLKTKEEWKRFREEEKQAAKAKKEEENARKIEDKRLKDEQKRKPKEVVGSLGAPIQASDIPALGPIPSLEPISAEEHRYSSESLHSRASPGRLANEPTSHESMTKVYEEVRMNDATEPDSLERPSRESSELERVLAEEAVHFGSDFEEHNKLELISSEDSFSAQAVSPTVVNPEPTNAEEMQHTPAKGLENAELIAARVLSSPVEPDTSITEENPSIALPDKTMVSKPSTASMKIGKELSTPGLHIDSIGVRSAPTATTETTISGPSTDPKSPKGEYKVSSWLKSTFLRRASKPVKPDDLDPSENNTSAIASGAGNAPDVESAEKGKNGIRNGKITHDDRTVAGDDEPVKKQPRDASSHRSSPLGTEGIQGRSELRQDDTPSSQGEEFEEARDHFDSEELAPPVAFKNTGRASDSPVRDSRFQEDL